MTDYEWYVPIDDRRHNYFQVLAREVDGPDGRERLCNEVKAKWATTLLHGFNDDDDVFVRENVQDFYDDELAYSQEHLIRADVVTIEWRALVSKYNRGIKTGTE
jgi:carbazole 1,9a-dioxygenase terminal dioxygenase component